MRGEKSGFDVDAKGEVVGNHGLSPVVPIAVLLFAGVIMMSAGCSSATDREPAITVQQNSATNSQVKRDFIYRFIVSHAFSAKRILLSLAASLNLLFLTLTVLLAKVFILKSLNEI